MWLIISIHAPHTGRDRCHRNGRGAVHKFQSTRPIRGATSRRQSREGAMMLFQSTRPIRGATALKKQISAFELISIHAPHTGRDMSRSKGSTIRRPFQSTRPIRGATKAVQQRGVHGIISIHAPHTGRDLQPLAAQGFSGGISIHAPHTGRDIIRRARIRPLLQFQSTRPIRGATASYAPFALYSCYFNPRAPYGARQNDLR